MKKKIIIFKNDRLGDLLHATGAISNISQNNPEKEIIIFLSEISKKFFFLVKKENTILKTLNYHLNFIEKIKIFFTILFANIEEIYIFSPKSFYFLLPIFFRKIKFFAICVNNINGYRRPSLLLRKYLYKYVINDRETKNRRKSAQFLLLELSLSNNKKNIITNIKVNISEKLKENLPTSEYALIHYKKKVFDKLKWGIDELDILIKEISKYHRNIVLIKDLEIDEMNKIFRNKFNTFDFETNRFYKNPGIVSFFDNIEGENLYNAIKFAKKIIATHGTMTSLAFLCKKPCLDLFQCEINNIDDYHRYKNSFYEFKPNYPGYDFIIPSKNIYKTIKKMQFSLSKK